MQAITTATVEVALFIKEVDNNMVFATASKEVKGSGATRDAAVANAIAQLQVNDPVFSSFISTGKQKIIAYYQANCNNIITKANKA